MDMIAPEPISYVWPARLADSVTARCAPINPVSHTALCSAESAIGRGIALSRILPYPAILPAGTARCNPDCVKEVITP